MWNGRRVIANGRVGEVAVHDPEDRLLTYKVSFSDGTADWYKADDVQLHEEEVRETEPKAIPSPMDLVACMRDASATDIATCLSGFSASSLQKLAIALEAKRHEPRESPSPMDLVACIREAIASDIVTCLSGVSASCLQKLEAALEATCDEAGEIPSPMELAACIQAASAIEIAACLSGVSESCLEKLEVALEASQSIEGVWTRGIIRGSTLIWNHSGNPSEIEFIDSKTIAITLSTGRYTAVLKNDDKLHWNDGDIWSRQDQMAWLVVTSAPMHNIRKEKSKSSDVVRRVAPGEVLYGTREGDWIRLSDGSGYSLMRERGEIFIKAENEADVADGSLPEATIDHHFQQLPSVGSWATALPQHQPRIGDEMEVRPNMSFIIDGVEYYLPGDRGRVSESTRVTERDGVERFKITWYRTGQTSTMEKRQWLRHFRFVQAGPELPSYGDEIESLPNSSLVTGGKEYYVAGDRGRVSKENSASNRDGIERFEVNWYRTGLTSTMKKNVWMQYFRISATGYEEPRIGNEMESNPNSSLDSGGKNYYKPYDRGRVTKENYTSSSDGIDRFEVTWYRSGLTSTMKTGMWLQYFRFVATGVKTPSIDDELQVLPVAPINQDGEEYSRGDRCRVTKESSLAEGDDTERFEVEWYRTKKTSMHKTETWLKTFRRIVKEDHVFSVMLEISKDIPFQYVWPTLQDDIYRAMSHINSSWRELGWRSQEDFEATLQKDVAENGTGAIARGITKWEAEKLSRAVGEVPVQVREDIEGADAADALRKCDLLDKNERRERDRERLLKVRTSLGEAVLREDTELADIIQNFEEQLNNDEIELDELAEIEEFLKKLESELGDMRVGYSGEERDDASDQTWSTMLHLDKDFPFDLVWPDVQEVVQQAIVTNFHLAGKSSGFATSGEMEAALRRGVESQGKGPIARGLGKDDAERLRGVLGGMLICTVEADEQEDLTELRTRLRERLLDARDMASDLPQSLASTLPRVEADLNDDIMFRRRHRAIEGFFDRLDTYARAKPKYEICVSRDHLLNSALIPILRGTPWQLRPGRLHVKYMGEDAEDAGGVTRAFLIHAGSLLGDANLGLFLPAFRGYLQLSSMPGFLATSHAVGDVHKHPIRWCRFLGRVLGMAVAHECPLRLLLVPSLCKKLLGQEICFEDLSFAPALNNTGGGGWYSSLKNLLQTPELDSSLVESIDPHSFLPSRSVQTFDTMIEYVGRVAPDEERWENGIDIVACLLRGAKAQEQLERALEAAHELLQHIVTVTSERISKEAIKPHPVVPTPIAHLNPSVGTWLHRPPKKAEASMHLPRGRRRAYQMLLGAISEQVSDNSLISQITDLLHEVLGADAMKSESEVLNISGMWTMWDEGGNKQLYFEWVHFPGSAEFMGQEFTDQGLHTISFGSISESELRWEIDGELFTGTLSDNGCRILDGRYYNQDGNELHELGQYTGMLMKSHPELMCIRPTVVPDTKTYITVGATSCAASSGKLYYEVKLGLDARYPQLGWLCSGFEKIEKFNVNEGVGDTAEGWAFDGTRHKFFHAGEKNVKHRPWELIGYVVIGLAVDIEAGVMQCSLNGEWDTGVQQTVELAGHSIYPAVSGQGFFALHMGKDTWQFEPPDESYLAWGIDGVLCRPPPLLDDSQPNTAVGSPIATSGSPLTRTTSFSAPTLERTTSVIPGVTENLSTSNLQEFAEAVARKTLVTNLKPYLGPLTEEFRKVAGEQKLRSLTWEQLQERIAGLQVDTPGWIEEWKSKTGYTFCDEEHEVVKLWWSFVSDRRAEDLPKLFEWCTNFPAIPVTRWKFHIQLLDDANKLPSMNSCRTDDRGIENRGVPEPIVYLPHVSSKSDLDEKMSKVNWEKGAANTMHLV